jgi:hypothetical protein
MPGTGHPEQLVLSGAEGQSKGVARGNNASATSLDCARDDERAVKNK